MVLGPSIRWMMTSPKVYYEEVRPSGGTFKALSNLKSGEDALRGLSQAAFEWTANELGECSEVNAALLGLLGYVHG